MTANPTERPEERDSLAEIEERLDALKVERGFSSPQALQLVKDARSLFWRCKQMEEALRGLDDELTRILPKTSDTMSAIRQREITALVQERIRAALSSEASPSDTEEEA